MSKIHVYKCHAFDSGPQSLSSQKIIKQSNRNLCKVNRHWKKINKMCPSWIRQMQEILLSSPDTTITFFRVTAVTQRKQTEVLRPADAKLDFNRTNRPHLGCIAAMLNVHRVIPTEGYYDRESFMHWEDDRRQWKLAWFNKGMFISGADGSEVNTHGIFNQSFC